MFFWPFKEIYKKNMNHKSILFISILFALIISLFLVPYYNIFWFEQNREIIKTSYSLEEIEQINDVLSKIDDKKILDEKMKKTLENLKQDFSKEKSLILFEKARQEHELAQKELQEKLKREEEQKQKEEYEKSIVYPKEFDITNRLEKLHIQERNLSCEAAATTDILSTILKTDIKETDILDKMVKDKTYGKGSYIWNGGKIIWWDPNNGFVWEMDWHQFNLTGYAIYEKPMSKIYDDYAVKYKTYNKFENNLGLKNPKEALSYMLKELVKGNYIQMRWDYCTDQSFEDWNIDRKITTEESRNWLSQKNYCYSFNQERRITWYTEEWKEVNAAKQSHNFVLLWYIWDIENPEKIIIRDTQTWRHIYPTSERLRKWELNDARAIIVYNKEENKTKTSDELNILNEELKNPKNSQKEEPKRREENSEETEKKD